MGDECNFGTYHPDYHPIRRTHEGHDAFQEQATMTVQLPAQDRILVSAINHLVGQAEKGMAKYGKLLGDNPAPIIDRVEHLIQEVIDQLQYLLWVKEALYQMETDQAKARFEVAAFREQAQRWAEEADYWRQAYEARVKESGALPLEVSAFLDRHEDDIMDVRVEGDG